MAARLGTGDHENVMVAVERVAEDDGLRVLVLAEQRL